jgi:hypothetical protein
MLTDWVFSQRKVNGVTVSVNPAVASAPGRGKSAIRMVMHGGRLLLERNGPDGRRAFYTLIGELYIPNNNHVSR